MSFDEALAQLHRSGSVTLNGAPAGWSRVTRVLFIVLMVLIAILIVGAVIGVIVGGLSGVPLMPMGIGAVTGIGLFVGMFFLVRAGHRSKRRYLEIEREPVILDPRGITLRGVGPIPWAHFGPAGRIMVPAEHSSGRILRAVMSLTPPGLEAVNHHLHPDLRERVSPSVGTFWRHHHDYVYVPGVEGMSEGEVIQIINAAHQMFAR